MRRLAALLLLAGCGSEPRPEDGALIHTKINGVVVEIDLGVTYGNRPVTPDQAAAMFGRVCMATAPSFQDAAAAMQREGVTVVSRTGTVLHPDLHLMFKVGQRDDGKPVCLMVFNMEGSPLDLDRAVAALRLPPGISGRTTAQKDLDLYSIGLVTG